MKTIHVETELPTTADKVWQAMQYPAAFLYVTRGVFGVPALAGRTEPVREGDRGTGWLTLFNLIPVTRHTIHVVEVDEGTRTIRSQEHDGAIKVWNHTLHVEPLGDHRCRYTDTIDIDAGRGTALIASGAVWVFRYRQRRWHKLVRNHLLPTGPRHGTPATT